LTVLIAENNEDIVNAAGAQQGHAAGDSSVDLAKSRARTKSILCHGPPNSAQRPVTQAMFVTAVTQKGAID